ncbi:conserved hypothetical protein [Nocardia seriolae]|nr:conserved hypothetical protein [Nocardia seriolae]
MEIRHDPDATLVRDTKDVGKGPILAFPPNEWTAFINSGIWQH